MSTRQELLREELMVEAKADLDKVLLPHFEKIKALEAEIAKERESIKAKQEGSHYYAMVMKD